MLINRQELLRTLESCSPGLAPKGGNEQSNCFCFQNNVVRCFSEEIYTEQDTNLDIQGAVPSKPLLETLRKLTEDELTITATDTKLQIKGQGRRASINLNQEILIPIGAVEKATKWTELPPAFGDALPMVAECAAEDNNIFELCCVRISPKGLEACDLRQAIRYAVATGVEKEVLIRGTSCKAFNGLGIAEMSETDSWWWIKTYTGLRAAIRKIVGTYPKGISDIFKAPVLSRVTLPASVVDVLARVGPFLEETATGKLATLCLKPGKMMIRSQNVYGVYEEIKNVDYDGPPLTLGLNPKYFEALIKKGLPIVVTEDSVRIEGGDFMLALALEKGK
jgi:hypothetical protein